MAKPLVKFKVVKHISITCNLSAFSLSVRHYLAGKLSSTFQVENMFVFFHLAGTCELQYSQFCNQAPRISAAGSLGLQAGQKVEPATGF